MGSPAGSLCGLLPMQLLQAHRSQLDMLQIDLYMQGEALLGTELLTVKLAGQVRAGQAACASASSAPSAFPGSQEPPHSSTKSSVAQKHNLGLIKSSRYVSCMDSLMCLQEDEAHGRMYNQALD